jgi:Tol biopolymer transport system component
MPVVVMTPRGPRHDIDRSTAIGTVDERDENSPATRTARITNFERKSPVLQAVNSFTLTPDGQFVIYGVTEQNPDGTFYSRLNMRSTNPANSSTVLLTPDRRNMDCFPTMCREEGSTLVVFQSNRGSIDTIDISSFRIQNGARWGGIQQLTRVASFNTHPSFASEALPIYFSALDDFPQAEPRIFSVRTEGSAYTNHTEIGEMPTIAENGRIYFARRAEDTKTYQLYSIVVEGNVLETILNDYNFAQSNCHSPAISPDGGRMLFVSDFNPDKSARANNNIWMVDLAGSRQPYQLTTNGSDDIAPLWSPTEPDVFYFLSNRRGVYNVWQMAFKSGR